jgi:ABC-type polysaccharide/polyol phosphate export permease
MAQAAFPLPMRDSVSHLVDTLRALVGRELRMRYKGSFFGIVWAVLSPLGTVAVLQFVFTRILPLSTPNFSVFLYSGLLPWVWFSSAVLTGATALTDNRDLVRTPFFARPLLPAVITCTNFLLYLFAFPVLLALILVNGLPLTRALVALPAIWIVQGILTLGFTVLIAAIGVLVRDVQHLMGVVMMFWFYLTPIFYDVRQLPPDQARWFSLNPMTAIVSAHRDVTLYGRFPDWRELAYWGLISSAILGVSLLIFRTLEDAFIEEA